MCVKICSVVISCQIYLNNNTDIPKCKWSRKCWGFLFWTLTSFTSHQSSSSIWLPDKWFFSRHNFGLDFKIGHFFKLCIQLEGSGSHLLANSLSQIFFYQWFYQGTIHKRRLPEWEGRGVQKMPKKETFISRFYGWSPTNSIRNYFWKNVGGTFVSWTKDQFWNRIWDLKVGSWIVFIFSVIY